jgi:cyclophilin family peptidyl-prolyl cis-trans isomerase
MKHNFIAFIVIFLAFSGALLGANPQVTLQVSGGVSGDIVLELYPAKAPITVGNFINYVRSGFYDGLIFHRVISDFMVQSGGFDADMVKKAGGDAITNESSNGLSNLAGTIAMARTPYPHSATSEFFINETDNLFLDYGTIAYDGSDNAYCKVGYCVFGKVISGMSVVNDIALLPTTDERPDVDVIIDYAEITLDVPYCAEQLMGDVDGDCDVDTEDMRKFRIQWVSPTCHGCYGADINNDGEVDFKDFAVMLSNWQNCNSITTTCD